MGSSTENSAYGPSRNPWDPTRVPGGSGGGSAAAVSAGLAPWALGSDTGGSIKQPAALCGIVGLRPTYGTVSRYGIVAFASSLDQVGPTAKTVRDTALLYGIIAGKDACDSTTVDAPPVELPVAEDLRGVRVGVPKEMNDAEGIEAGVKDAARRAIELCVELGAEVEECSLPRSVEYGLPCYYLIAPAEASSNLARYDGVRFGFRADVGDGDLTELYERTRDEGFGDEPKRRIMLGTYALSAGYYDAYYGQAQKVRTLIIREHAELFERFDVLVSPTSPTVAFELGAKTQNPLAMYLSDLLTIPSCMAGLPGLNIPCGLSEGCPSGCSSSGRSCPRTCSSASATRSSARSASTPCRSACDEEDICRSCGGVRARVDAHLRERARSRRLARRPRGRREAGARGRRARAVADRDARSARASPRHGRGEGRHRARPGRGEGASCVPDFEPVVGLEIHVHLKTRTKMFCRCELEYFAEPNTRTCPVCLAHPGALPVANRKAIEWTIKLGLALGCEIAEEAVFSRKNYFYPDNPKGYQISQYDQPLCIGGSLVVPGHDGDREIGFVRAHLEEDAAKTVHVGGATGRKVGSEYSLIDFNRGGTPLVEIVTQPDIRSADEAERFLRLLRQTIVELGISDAEMEKGTLRVDANVSVRPAGSDELRTRWELKNMNSFTFIGRGIDAAVRDQVAIYEAGATVEQHTYDYEPGTDRLTPHRTKEEADDYRYFPEPDLVPVRPEPETVERLRGELPELPGERIVRLRDELGAATAQTLVTGGLDALWAATVEAGADPVAAANVISNQLVGAGIEPAGCESGRAREARRRARRDPAQDLRRGDRARRRRRLQRGAVPRAEGGRRHVGARADRRRGARRERRQRRGLSRRQVRPARLLRRAGDEGDERPGRRARRQRARAQEARRLTVVCGPWTSRSC